MLEAVSDVEGRAVIAQEVYGSLLAFKIRVSSKGNGRFLKNRSTPFHDYLSSVYFFFLPKLV